MKHHLLGAALGLLVVFMPACEGGKEPEQVPAPPRTSRPAIPLVSATARRIAPEISGQDLDGRHWTLADWRGKVVLVDFWATWCGPCRIAIPHLVDLQDRLGPRGLEVVGISLDRWGRAAVEPFVRKMGINYPVIIDLEGRLAALYGAVQVLPTIFLIDREGRIAAQVIGAQPPEMIDGAVASLLAEE